MDWLEALIMGIVQGLAEYLPISSSGHLEICNKILGLQLSTSESIEFDMLLHVATALSTIVVLWHEFSPLCTSFFTFRRDSNFNYVIKILISCIPIAIIGVFFKESIEQFFGGNLSTVGICLCITAALLTFSYFFRTKRHVPVHAGEKAHAPRDITMTDAFIIGCAQAVAVLPGLSRSGTTIATGIIIGNKREQVAKFSFLMVIIPILGQALLDAKDIVTDGISPDIQLLPMLVGFLSSFIVGCVACKWMLNIVKKGKLVWFAAYCLIIGVICILKGF